MREVWRLGIRFVNHFLIIAAGDPFTPHSTLSTSHFPFFQNMPQTPKKGLRLQKK